MAIDLRWRQINYDLPKVTTLKQFFITLLGHVIVLIEIYALGFLKDSITVL